MGEIDLKGSEFWQSENCQVMVNPRDKDSSAEAKLIQSWANQKPELKGHLLFATSGSTGAGKAHGGVLHRRCGQRAVSTRLVPTAMAGEDAWQPRLCRRHGRAASAVAGRRGGTVILQRSDGRITIDTRHPVACDLRL